MSASDEVFRLFDLEPRRPVKVPESFLARVIPEDRARVEKEVISLASGPRDFEIEFRILRADDSIRWLTARGKLVDERPQGLFGVRGNPQGEISVPVSCPSMGRKPKSRRDPFGAWLLHLRKEKKLSQDALAAKIGVPQSTLAHWERTGKLTGREIIVKLSKALGVSVSELLRAKE